MALDEIKWGRIDGKTAINFSDCKIEISFEDNRVLTSYSSGNTPPELNRYIMEKNARILLKPALPDLPVLLKPETPVTIMPETNLPVFINLPLWISMWSGGHKNSMLLKDFQIYRLSKAWFGPPDNGEIAYSLRTFFSSVPYEDENLLLYTICPLVIQNRSSYPLQFERMCLRVPYLNIYRDSERFFTNKVTISFRGQEQTSQISIQKSPPETGENLKLAAEARKQEDNGLLSKSFYFFKSLYNG